MRIGELSRRTGVTQRALRYYEEQGLLRPQRLASGYRAYRERDVQAVARIRTLLAAGLGTAVIAEVLPCVRDDGGVLAPACAELTAELASERDRLDATIGELTAARALLDAIISAGPAPGQPPDCPPDPTPALAGATPN